MSDKETTPAPEGTSPRNPSPAPGDTSPPPPDAAASVAPTPSSAPPLVAKPPAATVEDASDSEDDQPVTKVDKGKGKEGAKASDAPAAAAVPPHDWQAVWSPAQNAYYFYNTKTMETTWTNPLASATATAATAETSASGGESPPWDPSAETLPTASAATAPAHAAASAYPPGAFSYGQASGSAGASYDAQAAYDASMSAGGIDPALQHLLPQSYNPLNPSSSTGYAAQARFNTKTGKYEADPNRAPEHLSDYSRMQRQNQAFFDQAAWERQREADFLREQAEGPKRKRATREEVAAFKAKKEAKRKKNNAWLRS